MRYRKRSMRTCCNGIIPTVLTAGFFICTLQASAQIVTNKTRPLTPQEKKSAIAFSGIPPSNVMTVKGVVATYPHAGYQNISAQVIWNKPIFSSGICITSAVDLRSHRKPIDKSLDWEFARSFSHHLPNGLSYLVWEGNNKQNCKNLPDTGLVSLTAPIPTAALKNLINERHEIKIVTLPVLRARTKGALSAFQEKIVSQAQLTGIDLALDWKHGFVYVLYYALGHDVLTVHVSLNDKKPTVISAAIAIP